MKKTFYIFLRMNSEIFVKGESLVTKFVVVFFFFFFFFFLEGLEVHGHFLLRLAVPGCKQ